MADSRAPGRTIQAGHGHGLVFANGNRVEIKIAEERLTLIEGTHVPHTGPPPHVHEHVDESFYVLEGTYALTRGDETLEAVAGTSVFVPRGTPHRFQPGAGGGRMLLLYSPGGFERYFQERHLEESRHGGDLNREQLAFLGKKHGMRLVER